MDDQPETHGEIDHLLCGEPVELEEERAVVEFEATDEMRVDDRGLVHGGFIFGLADHAAMLAVNEPTVVLTAAESQFVAPVEVGDSVVAEAEVAERDGRAYEVEASAVVDGTTVFEGIFETFVPESHVLDDE